MERFADASFILPALILGFVLGRAVARRGFRAARGAWEAERARAQRSLEDLRGRERAAAQTIDQLQHTLLEIPDVAQRLISAENPREIPALALDLADELFEPAYSVFYRLGRPGLVAVATRGASEYEVGHHLDVGEGVVGWAAVRQVAFTAQDAEHAAARAGGGAIARCWPRAGFSVALPLMQGSETLGVILLGPCARSARARELGRTLALVTSVALTSTTVLNRERLRARTDGLTGLLNKTHMLAVLEKLLHPASPSGQQISVFLFDIDHFKNFNDTHGHLAGDELLKEFAGLLHDAVRDGEYAGRYGGEEFVLIMRAGKQEALGAAERIRRTIAEHTFAHEETQPGGSLTISGGVATWPADGASAGALLECSDVALYAAKRAGRNRVVAFAPCSLGETEAEEKPLVQAGG